MNESTKLFLDDAYEALGDAISSDAEDLHFEADAELGEAVAKLHSILHDRLEKED